MVMRSANQFPVAQSTPGGGQARYRSEMFVPVVQGSANSDPTSSTSTSWQTMHERLDERRRQWNDEVGLRLAVIYTFC